MFLPIMTDLAVSVEEFLKNSRTEWGVYAQLQRFVEGRGEL